MLCFLRTFNWNTFFLSFFLSFFLFLSVSFFISLVLFLSFSLSFFLSFSFSSSLSLFLFLSFSVFLSFSLSFLFLSLFLSFVLSLFLSFLLSYFLTFFLTFFLPFVLSFYLSFFFLSLDLFLPTRYRCRGYFCTWSQSMTHTLGSLPWTWYRFVAENSIWRHTTLARDRYPCSPGGIRTHNPSKRAAADPLLRPDKSEWYIINVVEF